MRTAVDIVLEGVSNGSISKEDAKILLEAINQKGGITFLPNSYEQPSYPSPPGKPGDIWYSTNTNTTSDNKSDINE